jgi:LmbE family N-acetylglucosaminyl deacetylase
MRSILFSFAHPDDESFSSVGLASWCLDQGVEVVLSCATRGEAGRPGEPAVSNADGLGALREQELRAAAEIIGIQHVHLLDYRDRELADAKPHEIRRKLVTLLRQHRPDVVMTFDPNGFNAHPDHVAISRFTADAIAAAADPRWLPKVGEPHAVRRLLWTSPIAPWEAARSRDLASEPGVDFVLDISRWSHRKAEALRAHKSQHQSIERHFFNQPDVERILGIETFRQAWGPPLGSRPSADVFEGISQP